MPKKQDNYQAVNDEATHEDYLGRDVYARTPQKVIQQCQTPMVIGVHGDWGSGKTSLMMQTQDLLEKEGIRTVWFNPWEHQFEEAPIIPLLHEIKDRAISYKVKMEGLKLFSVLTSLAGEAILRITTGGAVKSEDILRQGIAFEEKYFETKSVSQRIHKHFQDVVNAVAGKNGRLVIFIDDLDRCLPPQALKVLEAIKLFLNAKNCVYVVGMAREVIEQAITHHYGELKLEGQPYLDKIIQLPFNIPPIDDKRVKSYLNKLNQNPEIKKHFTLIQKGIGRNPRDVKRFMNSLMLNDILARETHIPDYKPHILIKLLIFQLRFPLFYKYISRRPGEFGQIEEWARAGLPDTGGSSQVRTFLSNEELREILCLEPLLGKDDLKPYIHLAETTKTEAAPQAQAERKTLTRAEVEAAVKQGKSLAGENLIGVELSGANLRKADLFGVELRIANLRGANLREADLEEAVLEGADLRGANLGGANLRQAALSVADLEGANLRGANLRRAILMGADLGGTDLTGVQGFEKVESFKNTRLVNVKGLSKEQLEFAKSRGAIVEEE